MSSPSDDPTDRPDDADAADESRRSAPAGPAGAAGRSDAPDRPDESDQWRFDFEELGTDGAPRPSLQPESPSMENAFFVVVGAIGTLFVVLTAI